MEKNLENAQRKLSQFKNQVEQNEKERREQLTGIFKGLESVAEEESGKD